MKDHNSNIKKSTILENLDEGCACKTFRIITLTNNYRTEIFLRHL